MVALASERAKPRNDWRRDSEALGYVRSTEQLALSSLIAEAPKQLRLLVRDRLVHLLGLGVLTTRTFLRYRVPLTAPEAELIQHAQLPDRLVAADNARRLRATHHDLQTQERNEHECIARPRASATRSDGKPQYIANISA